MLFRSVNFHWKIIVCLIVFSAIIYVTFIRQRNVIRHEAPIVNDEAQPKPEPGVTNQSCPIYWELRSVNFNEPKLRSSLCYDQPAYSLRSNGDGYEICEVKSHNPLRKLVPADNRTYAHNVFEKSEKVIIYGSKNEVLTYFLDMKHDHEGDLIRKLLSMAKEFPPDSVTVVDIGCNIGTYTMQARAAGLPVVALDANIRNILRVHMAADEMNLSDRQNLKVFWAIISDKTTLDKMTFDTKGCYVGSAGLYPANMVDTIPVASARGDQLFPHISTRNIVMKMDIETHEHLFLRTATRIFDEKFVAVVQTEIHLDCENCLSKARFLYNFFTERNYSMFDINFNKLSSLDEYIKKKLADCFWIHNKFVKNSKTLKRK